MLDILVQSYEISAEKVVNSPELCSTEYFASNCPVFL